MLKLAHAPYGLNERAEAWVKLKPDYIEGVNDTLDVVIVGGYLGKGTVRLAESVAVPDAFLNFYCCNYCYFCAEGARRPFRVPFPVGGGGPEARRRSSRTYRPHRFQIQCVLQGAFVFLCSHRARVLPVLVDILAVAQVGSGYNIDELMQLQNLLSPCWTECGLPLSLPLSPPVDLCGAVCALPVSYHSLYGLVCVSVCLSVRARVCVCVFVCVCVCIARRPAFAPASHQVHSPAAAVPAVTCTHSRPARPNTHTELPPGVPWSCGKRDGGREWDFR